MNASKILNIESRTLIVSFCLLADGGFLYGAEFERQQVNDNRIITREVASREVEVKTNEWKGLIFVLPSKFNRLTNERLNMVPYPFFYNGKVRISFINAEFDKLRNRLSGKEDLNKPLKSMKDWEFAKRALIAGVNSKDEYEQYYSGYYELFREICFSAITTADFIEDKNLYVLNLSDGVHCILLPEHIARYTWGSAWSRQFFLFNREIKGGLKVCPYIETVGSEKKTEKMSLEEITELVGSISVSKNDKDQSSRESAQ